MPSALKLHNENPMGHASRIDPPDVSVILPTYNRAAFLSAAIASVLSQSLQNLELIVVDDGSTDATPELVKRFGDDRLVYLRQDNRGRSAARNLALAHARADLIAFLDSDDEYLPDKCALQVAFMRANPDIGMLYTSALCIDSDGNPIPGAYDAKASGSIYREVAFFVPVTITLPTVMVRREVLDTTGAFDLNMSRFEDTDLWRRVAKHYPIGALDTPTCRLRTHAGNTLLAQDPGAIVEALDYYVDKVFAEDRDVGTDFLKYGAAQLYAHYALALLMTRGHRGHGVQLLGKACALRPTAMPSLALEWARAWFGSRALRPVSRRD